MYEYGRTTEIEEAAERAADEFVAYLRELAAERRKHPGEDLLSHLVSVRDAEGDRLTEDELVTTCILLLNAGHEATVNVSGNGTARAAAAPRRSCSGCGRTRALLPTAIEELMRFDSPLQLFERTATEDVEIGGITVGAGQKIAALLGAANRDPAVFDAPGHPRRRPHREPAHLLRRRRALLHRGTARPGGAAGLVRGAARPDVVASSSAASRERRPEFVIRGLRRAARRPRTGVMTAAGGARRGWPRSPTRRGWPGWPATAYATEHAYGVTLPELRTLARDLGRDHELAAALWETGVHEARILAGMVDDPALVDDDQFERWAHDFDSWDLCDQVCANLFRRTPLAYAKAVEWTGREELFVKRAGFALIAGLVVADKRADDARFAALLEPAGRRGRRLPRPGPQGGELGAPLDRQAERRAQRPGHRDGPGTERPGGARRPVGRRRCAARAAQPCGAGTAGGPKDLGRRCRERVGC